METLVSATELARKLGDYLARVRYRRESLLVERNGKPVARIVPAAEPDVTTLARAMAAWSGDAALDPGFVDDLEKVVGSDSLPEDPWAL